MDGLPLQLLNSCVWQNLSEGVVGLEAYSLPLGREAALAAEKVNEQLCPLAAGQTLQITRQVEWLRGPRLQAECDLIKVCAIQERLLSIGDPA